MADRSNRHDNCELTCHSSLQTRLEQRSYRRQKRPLLPSTSGPFAFASRSPRTTGTWLYWQNEKCGNRQSRTVAAFIIEISFNHSLLIVSFAICPCAKCGANVSKIGRSGLSAKQRVSMRQTGELSPRPDQLQTVYSDLWRTPFMAHHGRRPLGPVRILLKPVTVSVENAHSTFPLPISTQNVIDLRSNGDRSQKTLSELLPALTIHVHRQQFACEAYSPEIFGELPHARPQQ